MVIDNKYLWQAIIHKMHKVLIVCSSFFKTIKVKISDGTMIITPITRRYLGKTLE